MSEQFKNARDVLSHALAYAAKGISVLPLHAPSSTEAGGCTCHRPSCSSIGKHPAVKRGVHGASCDLSAVTQFFTGAKNYNLGIATGAINNLVIVDIDKKSGGLASLEAFAQHGTPLTSDVKVNTGGGGFHLYFRHPGVAVANSAGKVAPGIDLRVDNGYVVAPPSMHQSGNSYTWAADIIDWDEALPPLPQWLFEKASRPPQAGLQSVVLVPGTRNGWLTSYAGRLRRGGATQDELIAALDEQNHLLCRPPLSKLEVDQIAKSVARYKPERRAGTSESSRSQRNEDPRREAYKL